MTGICTVCARSFKLRAGLVVFHRQRDVFDGDTIHMLWPQPPCPGWGHPPGDSA